MPYIHFTEEQKLWASEVDLVEFLRHQGEKLIRSGPEYRLASDHSITVQGNEWYDHAIKEGGGPISFVQQFYNLSYPEAITCLLGGEQGIVYASAQKQEEKPRKEFALPSAGQEMRRMYAYLLKHRFLDRNVVNAFVRAGLLYESCEKFKDREYHNAVFVGKDENGVPRHAHKRSLNSLGKTFRINVEGSDPRCSFHYTGTSRRLYVFEAPIDLMSFLSRYPRGWQEHSYVALCGTAEHAMLWMLEQNPGLRAVCLCLDHDEAGIEASGRLADILHERGYDDVGMLQPEHKDWNEDLKASRGLPAQEAEEHPQLIASSAVCGRIGVYMEECVIPERVGRELTNALCGYEMNLRRDYPEGATTCIELASALALYAYGRGLRQLGEPHSSEELLEQLRGRIHPHQNRSSLNSRTAALAEQTHNVLKLASRPGIRSEAEKRELTEGWLELALSCAKISVKYEADVLKQQQKQTPPDRSPAERVRSGEEAQRNEREMVFS
ncbi:DUF3991 and toprim domain-containing protein [Flintibacter muris]|uniref:DUF3991 and toprim domain-containing protein n=1 Tax=Flintibacter muris TaxID=2941327 RepID=UPI00203EB1C2|nr:DUF3991 and toprim domain-containing protein [Flintibacter muris]